VVYVWDTQSGQVRWSLPAYESAASDVTFSPDGQHLVTAGYPGGVRLWDLEAGQQLLTLPANVPQNSFVRIACSPDGRWLAGASLNYPLVVWDGRPLQEKSPAAPFLPQPGATPPDKRVWRDQVNWCTYNIEKNAGIAGYSSRTSEVWWTSLGPRWRPSCNPRQPTAGDGRRRILLPAPSATIGP
jgi:WD40 repeat protein